MLQSLFNSPAPTPGLMDRMKQAVARTRTVLQERMDDLLALARPHSGWCYRRRDENGNPMY